MRASTRSTRTLRICTWAIRRNALHGGPFLLDAYKVALWMFLRLAYQKLTIPKTDFHLDRGLPSELLRPINGTRHVLPEE